MNSILNALLMLSRRSLAYTEAQATQLYYRLWLIIGYTLIGTGICISLNVGLGWRLPSLYLAIALAIAAIFFWAKPANLLLVVSFGALEGVVKKIFAEASLLKEVEDILKGYLNLLKLVLLGVLTFLFFAGTISFEGHLRSVLLIAVALVVTGLYVWMWPADYKGKWGRKFVSAYALVVIAFSLFNLIPGATWVKHTGMDPHSLETTESEQALYRLRRTREEIKDSDRKEEIDRIRHKVERREALTGAEEAFIRESESGSQSKSESTPRPSDGWSILRVPANEWSPVYPLPAGVQMQASGTGVLLYNVYSSGERCAWSSNCPDGPVGVAIKNETSETVQVVYRFVSKK